MKKIYTGLAYLKYIFTGFLLVFISLQPSAQSITNYSFAASSGTFTALSGATTAGSTGSIDESAYNNIPIGFDFWYMGARYTTISASSNGWMALGSALGTDPEGAYFYVNNIASATAARPILAPLWDDLSVTSLTDISYLTSGTAGSRTFTVQCLNMKWNFTTSTPRISFQVKLYESTGKIEFIYRGENTGSGLTSASATIGISGTGTGSGTFRSLNNSGTSPTVSSTVETTTISARPATGQTYGWTPAIPTAPTSLSFTSVAATSMTLNWTDNSSNETGFAIYRSTDGTNYSYITKTAAGATSSAQSGLTAATTYYWRVYAVTEGGLSTALSGSRATSCTAPNISQIPTSNIILNYTFNGNANDASATNNDGTLRNSPALTTDRFNIPNSAYTFNGSTQYVSTANAYSNPGNFTISIWFKTATTSGGKLIGFGNAQTGSSTAMDRHLYMNNAGQIYFGVYPGSIVTINSPLAYNDNNWHLATATLSSTAGMVLYMDGVQVAANANTTAQNYTGYWKIGFDNTGGWTSQPTSFYFNGALDDALVYHTALNSAQVATLYNSPDGAGGNTPVCAGSALNLTATTVSGASYSWTGPNGFTSSAQNPSLTYTSAYAGIYTVVVTSAGCNATAYKTIATAATSSTISYAGSPYCKTGGTASVTFSGTTGGTYSSTAGLSINATTGAVTLGTSTAGTYTVTYTVAGGCTATATIVVNAAPTTSAAGPDQTGAATCGLTTVTLAANTPSAGTGAWSIISGTGGTVTTPTSPTSTFTGTAGTSYTLRWTISSGGCTASADDVVITFNRNPTTSAAGPNQTGTGTCGSTTATLAANTPAVGTGAWSIISGTGGTVTTPASPTSAFTGTAGTSYTLRWTISNSPCTASTDDVVISFGSMPSVSGTATETCVGGSTGSITASASGGATPFTYSLNAGAYQASPTFTGLAAATYTLNVKTSAGCISSTSVTVNPYAASADNQNAVANDEWTGHMYDGTSFSNYIGQFTETETFDELFGGAAVCFNVVSSSVSRSIYTETFSVKFRMTSTKRGLYVADLGSDDGSRLTVDGTMVYNNWSDQGFATRPSVLMSLTGNSPLLYEYYENAGNNQVKFQNLTLVLANTLSVNATQSICIGNAGSAISGDVYGTLPSGITLSGTGYQWSYSTTPGGTRTTIAGATGATFTPSASAAPFNAVGTYYIYRNAILSSANNIAPNPYVATNESNAAVITVYAIPAATISYTGSPYCSNAGTASVTRSGTSGGTYSSTAGLTIDTTTGDITLASSTPGTYTVTYTMAAAGGCSVQTATASVTITALPAAAISYTGSPYIQNGGTASVTFSGTTGGTYSSTAGLTINATTGAVTLGSSTPGTYTVTYTIAAAGGCAVYTATAGIVILPSTKTFTGTGNFSDAARWTGGTVPVAGENLIIDGTCTVDNNAGTDNIAYGTLVIGTASARTLNWQAGGTNRLNITDLSHGSAISTLDMTNGGTLVIRGTITATNMVFTPGAGTIEIQSTITLLPAPVFNNLVINGTGITVKISAAATLNGNLTITSGNFNANNFNLSVKKNWTNNVSTAAFIAGTGTVTFNGTTAQSIGGSFGTTFTNLTLANTAATVTLNANASITGNLSVTNGTFDLGAFTANRATAGGTLSVSNNATLKIGGTNTFPSNYTTNTLVVASTVEYSGASQTVSNKTYGNLTLSSSGGAAVKTFPGTALAVVGNLSSTLGAGSSVTFTAASNITITGNVSIGASTTFNGGSYSHSVGGNWVNNGTYNGNTGTVTFTGSGKGISGTGAQNFNNLTVAASFFAFPNSSFSLTGSLSTISSGSLTQAAGGTLLMTGTGTSISGAGIALNNLTVSGTVSTAASFSLAGNLSVSGSFAASAGALTMSGASKTISGAGTINFAVLSVPGSVTTASGFSISSALAVGGSFSASAGTATFTGTASLNGMANLYNVNLNGTSLQLTSNATLGIAGSFTITAGILNVTSSVPNTVNFNGTGAQSINSIAYYNLILSNGNTKTAAGNITTNRDIMIDTGTTFNAVTYTHSVYGNWINNGTFIPGTSTVQFVGPATAYLSGATTFNILTSNTSSETTELRMQSNVTADTVHMINGIILTGTDTITITGNRTGNGFINGHIRRIHAFTTGIAYAFEGPDNTILFSAVSSVTDITVSVVKESVSDFPFGAAMGRYYNINIPSGTYTATLRLHYEDDELNGNLENDMGLWQYDSIQWIPVGKTANDSVANYVEHSGLTDIINRWTCSINPSVVTWNGSVSSDWNTAANWTVYVGAGSTPPSPSDVAVIGGIVATHQPTISTAVTVKNLVFVSNQAMTLTMAGGGSLTTGDVQGVWNNAARHTINVGSQTINVNGGFAMSDGIDGNAIDLNIGSGNVAIKSFLDQSGGADINFTGAGTLSIAEDFHYTSGTFTGGAGTVIYNGHENQHIAHVNYNNLTVDKAGGLATIDSTVNIAGDILISSGQLDNNATINVTGNVTISAGTILHNNYMIHIGGNWVNNGTFIATGAHTVFNGSGTQTISATTFNNLVIHKPVGSSAVLTGNIALNGNLDIISGTLNISSYTCDRIVLGGAITLADSATLIVSGNNAPVYFASGSLAVSSTVIADGTGPQAIYGETFGNMIFRNAGLKTLIAPITVKGTLTIENGATFDGGTQTLTLDGNWVNNGTFIPSAGTIVATGTGKTISGVTAFNIFSVYGSYTFLSNLTFNSLLAINSTGSLSAGPAIVTTMNGDLVNSGILNSLGTTTFTGNVLQTLSLINAVQTVAQVVNFNGTVSPEMVSTSAPQFGYLNINNTGGVNPSVGWTILYSLTVGNGASFNGGNSAHNILGNVTNSGTITSTGTLNFIPSSAATVNLGSSFSSTGTVNFGGAGALTIAGNAGSFHNVVISNTNAAGITSSADWNISNNFTVNSGSILNAGGRTYTVGGNLLNNGTINSQTSAFSINGTGTQDIYSLSAFNKLTFNKATDSAVLSSNITVDGELKMNSGTVNLNALSLGIPGTSTFTSGTINNGTVTATGTKTTFAGTQFGAAVTATSDSLYLDGSTFNNTATLTKNGASDIIGLGGNTFNNTATIANSGTGYLIMGNTSADIFNASTVFTNTGTNALYTAYNAAGNQFNGNVTFNNTGTASTIVSGYGPSSTATYNGNIVLNNTSSGGIYFGNTGGQTTLAPAKTITVGGTGFNAGTLMLYGFHPAGTTAQALTLTGTATLRMGPATAFDGNITFSSPQVLFDGGSTFNGTTAITKTGATQNNSVGGNLFNGATTLANSGSGAFVLGHSTGVDTFNDNLTLTNTGTGGIYPAYNSAGHQFNGNIIVNQTSNSSIYFCSGTGTATLATGKTITVGTGFSAGTLNLTRFTQAGNTAQTLSLTGTAMLQLGAASVFNGNVSFTSPQLLLNGTTLNGTATLTKNGATNNTSTGGNIFNGVTTLNCSGSGSFELGDTIPETFNADLTINNTGTARVQIGIGSAGNLFNGNVTMNYGGSTGALNMIIARNTGSTATINGTLTLNCTNTNTSSGIIIANDGAVAVNGNIIVSSTNGRGILFGAASGSVTLGNGFTISDAGAGSFTTGTLTLNRFTQTGSTAQNIALTGTANLLLGTLSQFNGPVNFTAPQLFLNGSQYNNTAVLRKTGATDNTSNGGNIFNAATTISNNGTGFFRLGNITTDDFNSDATFVQTGSGLLQPAYGSSCTIAGNLTTQGTATAITFRNTTTLDGTGAQSITSSISPTFTNLAISNTGNTVTTSVNINIAGNLSVTSGTFDLGTFTADRLTAGGALTVASSAMLKIGGTNTIPANYSTHSIGAASTVEYNGTNQSVGVLNSGQAYGHLVVSGSATEITSGDITVRNNLSVSGSFNINTHALKIGGSITNSGTFTATNGTIEMNGTSAQTIPAATFSGNEIKNLTINNNAGVTLGGSLDITAVLLPSGGSFQTGGYLTLRSAATQTALIDGSGAGSVLGNVTMQRYLASGFGYKYFSSPFQGATVNEFSDDLNLAAAFPSFYRFDENLLSAGWVNYTNPAGTLVPGYGYAGNFGAVSAPKTVDITGVVNNNTIALPALYNHNRPFTKGFNLVGNPYPSPIDWDASSGWTRTNIDNAVYYFNASTTDQYGGVYSSYINGVSSDGVAGNIIPAMQGFFVHVSDGSFPVTGQLTMNNNTRTNDPSPVFHSYAGQLLRISAGFADAGTVADAAVIYFDNRASQNLDTRYDAVKMMNNSPDVPNLYAIAGSSDRVSIRAMRYPQDSITVQPLGLKTEKEGWVTFTARDIQNIASNLNIYLRDAKTNTYHDLRRNPDYRLFLPAADYQGRFFIVFSKAALSSGVNGNEAFTAYSSGGQLFINCIILPGEKNSIAVFNTSGQLIHTQELTGSGSHAIQKNFTTGTYVVSLSSNNKVYSKKVLIGN